MVQGRHSISPSSLETTTEPSGSRACLLSNQVYS